MSELDVRAHEVVIDRLLYLHLDRQHLFCLKPTELVRLKRSIQFGPQARRALDIIGRRQQDYAASLRSAPYHLVLQPLGLPRPKAAIGKQMFVRPEDIQNWLANRPALFVENEISDGALLGVLIRAALPTIGGTGDLVSFEIAQGGGSALGATIQNNVNKYSVGMCVCDSDTNQVIPPFRRGTTGSATHQALRSVGMVAPDGQSLDACHAFFSFHPTAGWSIENLIGPSTLELFFRQAPECNESFQRFLTTFPMFPDLDLDAMREWRLINFKSENQDVATIFQGAAAFPEPLAMMPARAAQLSSLTIPAAVIPFIIASSRTGRHHKALQISLRKDLSRPAYGEAIQSLAAAGLTAFAADAAINFA